MEWVCWHSSDPLRGRKAGPLFCVCGPPKLKIGGNFLFLLSFFKRCLLSQHFLFFLYLAKQPLKQLWTLCFLDCTWDLGPQKIQNAGLTSFVFSSSPSHSRITVTDSFPPPLPHHFDLPPTPIGFFWGGTLCDFPTLFERHFSPWLCEKLVLFAPCLMDDNKTSQPWQRREFSFVWSCFSSTTFRFNHQPHPRLPLPKGEGGELWLMVTLAFFCFEKALDSDFFFLRVGFFQPEFLESLLVSTHVFSHHCLYPPVQFSERRYGSCVFVTTLSRLYRVVRVFPRHLGVCSFLPSSF